MNYIPENDYKKVLSMMPFPCIDVAIICEGKVLLVKRKDEPAKDEWWVPGGRILKGETMKQCAIRKAKEEVNIDCVVGPIIYTAETIFDNGPWGIPVHTVNSCYLMFPIKQNFNIFDDVEKDSHQDGFIWVSKNSKIFHPYMQNCLTNLGLTY